MNCANLHVRVCYWFCSLCLDAAISTICMLCVCVFVWCVCVCVVCVCLCGVCVFVWCVCVCVVCVCVCVCLCGVCVCLCGVCVCVCVCVCLCVTKGKQPPCIKLLPPCAILGIVSMKRDLTCFFKIQFLYSEMSSSTVMEL